MSFLHEKIEKYVLIEFGSIDFFPTAVEMHKSIDKKNLSHKRIGKSKSINNKRIEWMRE